MAAQRTSIIGITLLTIALALPSGLFADQKINTMRFAYTPVMLSKQSYVSVVTPASYVKANQKLTVLVAKVHQEFNQAFNTDLAVNVGVKLLPKKQFFEETGAPKWTNALFFQNQIIVPIENFNKINWDKLSQTITHEYTHAVVYSLSNGSCPAWLDEGLAQTIENSDNEILEKSLELWLKNNPPLALRKLSDGFTKLKVNEIGPAYSQSKIAVNLLLKDYGGAERLFEFIRFTGRYDQRIAFEAVYGLTLAEFQEQLNLALTKLDSRKTLLASRNQTFIFQTITH